MQLRLKYTFSYFKFYDYKSNTEDLFEYLYLLFSSKKLIQDMKKPKPKPKTTVIKPSLTCFVDPKKSANLVHTLKHILKPVSNTIC